MFDTLAMILLVLPCSSRALHGLKKDQPDVLTEVQELIDRVLLPANKSFYPIMELLSPSPETQLDTFELDSQNGKVVLRGSSGVALSSAFGWYLKYFCNCSMSSWGRGRSLYQLENFPSDARDLPLPSGDSTNRYSRATEWSYYQNVVSASYSMAWWDWSRWRREIDWMAISGINLPLSFTGQEIVLEDVFRNQYNVGQDGMDAFFAGPAFLAWNRMSNMRGFGGPLPRSWILGQAALQKKILTAMRTLGMAPVLAGFSGRVPQEFVENHPEAMFIQQETWNDFTGDYGNDFVLAPTDPLFVEVGAAVTKATIKYFGANSDYGNMPNIYNMDTFNEMKPPSNDTAYLSNASSAVYRAMVAGDSSGIWLMQGWLFLDLDFWGPDEIGAYLSKEAVPDDRVIVLDLAAEHYQTGTKQKKIWPKLISANPPVNKSIIWCALHNYGGRRDIYGNLSDIVITPVNDFESLQDASASNNFQSLMIGTGITPEAIEQNPVYYELMNEMTWRLNDLLLLRKPDSTSTSISRSNNPNFSISSTRTETKFFLDQWVQLYAARRYGSCDANSAGAAWKLLLSSVYSDPTPVQSAMEEVPKFIELESSQVRVTIETRAPRGRKVGSAISHANSLSESWGGLLAQESTAGGGFSYDLTDIGRAVLCTAFETGVALFTAAYDRCSWSDVLTSPQCLPSLQSIGRGLLELIGDTDLLLSADVNFLVGTWLADAVAWASEGSDTEEVLYMLNAKNQITLWGPNGEITDYASKPWAGLVGDYYSARWDLFIVEVTNAVVEQKAFNKTAFKQDALVIGQQWYQNTIKYPTQASGEDAVTIGKAMRKKYAAGADDSYITEDGKTIDPASSTVLLDLRSFGSLPVGTLAWLCNIEPLCTAFTSNGLLALSTDDSIDDETGTVLYYASDTAVST